MKKPRNPVTITLMLSSIVLLLVFQFFWVRSAYNKAFDDLHKETNMLFRSTVFAMRDSVIQQAIEQLPGDSTSHKFFRRRRPWDSLHFSGSPADSMANRINLHDKTARVQVYASPRGGEKGPRSMEPRFTDEHVRRDFMFHLGPDSLKIDSIKYYFKTAFTKAGINLPFRVLLVKRGEKFIPKDGSFVSEPVRISPMNRYAVSVSNVQGMLIREIAPQILFSVFLTLLTIGSFYIMYRSIRTQQRLVELKNDFISNVTHELKTPITTVGVAIEALRNFKGLDNPQLTQEYLSIAQNELNRLTILTDKVLKTAIFENNGVTFQPEKVDLEKLVEQVLASMKLVFEKNGSKITFVKEGRDFILSGGADHLTNVMYNLLDNAIKYSPPSANISVTLKDMTDRLSLSIQDNGLGIAKEFQTRIFDKFFRVPTGDIHNIKGYGLGLSYVDSVIRSHHGSIEVVSSPGKGSCFIINLPRGLRSDETR